jgi:hypothetical protein
MAEIVHIQASASLISYILRNGSYRKSIGHDRLAQSHLHISPTQAWMQDGMQFPIPYSAVPFGPLLTLNSCAGYEFAARGMRRPGPWTCVGFPES